MATEQPLTMDERRQASELCGSILITHFATKATFEISNLDTLWSRINTIFTWWIALLGIAIWLFGTSLARPPSWMTYTLWVAVLLVLALFVWSVCLLFRIGQPTATADPYDFNTLGRHIIQFKRAADQDVLAGRAPKKLECETTYCLASNWSDVADHLGNTNRERLAKLSILWRLLMAAVLCTTLGLCVWATT